MLLYAITILVSAFLLFQVQPVIAKIILPWFGGTAAVWTTCILFFQFVLLLGYLYAHALIRYLNPRMQMAVHSILLGASALALPIYPNAAWKPSGTEEPTLAILFLLALTVGLPYFLLSTTGPLLQAWYARRFKGAMPYRLYALSNAGSMFALISYPVLVEPRFTNHRQTWMWSAGYGMFALLCVITAIRSRTSFTLEDPAGDPAERLGIRVYALWLALPACASALLLAVTNHLSQNVAAIPFLWVLPLSIYLLTFILSFEARGWYSRNPYLQLLAVALGSMAFAISKDTSANVPVKVMLPLFGLGLFTCCMVCHGELVRLKPHPRYLTQFYVMIAAGGALGGLLVAVVAPNVFNAIYELQFGLIACALLTLIVLQGDSEAAWFRGLLRPPRMVLGFAIAAAIGFIGYHNQNRLLVWARGLWSRFSKTGNVPDDFDKYVLLAALAIAALMIPVILRGGRLRKQWAALGAEALVLMLTGFLGFQMRELTAGYRLSVRNFYGALRVRDSGTPQEFSAARTLTHGTINHGEQFLNPARHMLPTTYYGPDTGVGLAIRAKQKDRAIRVGVIGLGTGTLASYGRLGDYYRFYEINPVVLRLARSEFTYLADSPAKKDVAMGDARLSLEREAPENFDVLAVDAFSSDSIPVHLLTLEAIQVYFRHLKPDGILAVHISNRYLDLQPVLAGHAGLLAKIGRVVDTEDDESTGVFGATWVLLASTPAAFEGADLDDASPLPPKSTVRLWTDDFSNLYQILK
jgi:SAM-dependent methyltransferase